MKLLMFTVCDIVNISNVSDRKCLRQKAHLLFMLYCRIVCKTHSPIGWQCHHDDNDDYDFDEHDDDDNDDCHSDTVYHI